MVASFAQASGSPGPSSNCWSHLSGSSRRSVGSTRLPHPFGSTFDSHHPAFHCSPSLHPYSFSWLYLGPQSHGLRLSSQLNPHVLASGSTGTFLVGRLSSGQITEPRESSLILSTIFILHRNCKKEILQKCEEVLPAASANHKSRAGSGPDQTKHGF